jgi:hypothetical protein
MPDSALHMLLVEPEPLLRRTVSLTARTLGLGQVHEAGRAASIDVENAADDAGERIASTAP